MWYDTTTAGSGQVSVTVNRRLGRVRRLLRNVARHRLAARHATQILLDQRRGLRARRSRRRARASRCSARSRCRGTSRTSGIDAASRSCHAADRLVLVGMRREGLVEDDLRQPAERLVLEAHPPLFLHDLALGRELVVAHVERRHPIGLEPQDQRQVLRRHRLPVDRRVFVGERVGLAADARDPSTDADRARTFFEPLNIRCSNRCAKPVRPGASSFDPTWYQSGQMDDRRRVVFEKDHLQAVRQRRHRVVELAAAGRRSSARAALDRTTARRRRPPAREPSVVRDHATRLCHCPPRPRLDSSVGEPRLERRDASVAAPAGAGRAPPISRHASTSIAGMPATWLSGVDVLRRRPTWRRRWRRGQAAHGRSRPTAPPSSRRRRAPCCRRRPTCAASSDVAADLHAVRDLHEVVDLRAGADARLADGRTIDRRLRADLHVVLDDDAADLRNLLVRCRRAGARIQSRRCR